MGHRLSIRDDAPQIVYLSTSVRTKETMKLITKGAGWENTDLIEKDWLYLASPQEYLKTIEKMHDEVDHLGICGHNPTITSIINYLAGENIGNVPTCGMAIIEFEVERWKHIGENSGTMIHYDYPKSK